MFLLTETNERIAEGTDEDQTTFMQANLALQSLQNKFIIMKDRDRDEGNYKVWK